ncbi:MAG: hypothetical protein AAFV90_05075 [Cyanobacteria bacterium J06634_5]
MDVALLVKLLAPCLPGLMALGKKVGEASAEAGATAAAKKVGEQSAAQAGKIWQRLWPKVSAKEAAKEAAEDVAQNPADEDSLGALRKQLKKILESDVGLAAEVEALLTEAKADPQGTWIQVQGDGNQVIGSMGGNAKAIGSVTGDVTM